LTGTYQVILGPQGGCGSGAPHSYPSQAAKITNDGTNLTAVNECAQQTQVRVGANQREIFFYGEHATLDFSSADGSGVGLIITDDHQNSWQKLR
jgi:hypothetical protein